MTYNCSRPSANLVMRKVHMCTVFVDLAALFFATFPTARPQGFIENVYDGAEIVFTIAIVVVIVIAVTVVALRHHFFRSSRLLFARFYQSVLALKLTNESIARANVAKTHRLFDHDGDLDALLRICLHIPHSRIVLGIM
jgi:hypothetical protein